jgi:hypothetical protein
MVRWEKQRKKETDVDHLRAKMSEDSTLTVEVPIPHDRVPAFNRQIKITQ